MVAKQHFSVFKTHSQCLRKDTYFITSLQTSSKFPRLSDRFSFHFHFSQCLCRSRPLPLSAAQFSRNLLHMREHPCWAEAPGTLISTAWGFDFPCSLIGTRPAPTVIYSQALTARVPKPSTLIYHLSQSGTHHSLYTGSASLFSHRL